MEQKIEPTEEYVAPSIEDLGTVADVTLGGLGLNGEGLLQAPAVPTPQTST